MYFKIDFDKTDSYKIKMIRKYSFEYMKTYYDTILNPDKTLYTSSNDENTPIDCVVEMLDKIPHSFFKNPKLQILDPCCGNGNFGMTMHHKLLSFGISSDEVLYFNDTNSDRLKNIVQIFSPEPSKITCMDFLEMDEDKKYDLVMANPPFASMMKNGERTSKNHNLIQKFLEKALLLLKEGGYLVFITPDNWMSCADRNVIVKKLSSLQIHHLNIHTAKKYFKKIGSSFTWYVIQNTKSKHDFVVEGIYNRKEYSSVVCSQSRSYIPLLYTDIVQSILNKTIDNNSLEKIKVETTSFLHHYTKKHLISKEKTSLHSFRLIHTPTQTVYSSIPHKYQTGYKVFISLTNKYSVFVDDCGMTQSIAFIRCSSKDEADSLAYMLGHNFYRFVNNICRWGNFNNVRILQRLPRLEDLELTEDEMLFIENHL